MILPGEYEMPSLGCLSMLGSRPGVESTCMIGGGGAPEQEGWLILPVNGESGMNSSSRQSSWFYRSPEVGNKEERNVPLPAQRPGLTWTGCVCFHTLYFPGCPSAYSLIPTPAVAVPTHEIMSVKSTLQTLRLYEEVKSTAVIITMLSGYDFCCPSLSYVSAKEREG